ASQTRSLMSADVQAFSRRQRWSHRALRRPAAEKRQGTKSRRERVRWGCGGLYYGDLVTVRELNTGRLRTVFGLQRERNLNVLARILLNGDFTFCPTCDLNELGVVKKHVRQLLRDIGRA